MAHLSPCYPQQYHQGTLTTDAKKENEGVPPLPNKVEVAQMALPTVDVKKSNALLQQQGSLILEEEEIEEGDEDEILSEGRVASAKSSKSSRSYRSAKSAKSTRSALPSTPPTAILTHRPFAYLRLPFKATANLDSSYSKTMMN